MRNKTNMSFSLVFPSRNRPFLVNNCIRSFYEKASNPMGVEAIVLCDYDDETMRHFECFCLSNQWNIKIIFQHQSRRMIHSYNNYGSQCSTGKYIWQINDDVEMATNRWDEILDARIDEFLVDKPDRILYVHVDDSTHVGNREQHGCCFPILSKETIDAQNCHMPDEIDMWGADVWLYSIFKRLPNRILDVRNSVKLLHHSRHNNTTSPDATAYRVADVSRSNTHLSPDQFENYVNLLMRKINA